MCWPLCLVQRIGQFPEHGRIAIDRTHRLPPDVGERRQAVIGAEDVAAAVDKIEMILGHGRGIAQGSGGGNAGMRGRPPRVNSFPPAGGDDLYLLWWFDATARETVCNNYPRLGLGCHLRTIIQATAEAGPSRGDRRRN